MNARWAALARTILSPVPAILLLLAVVSILVDVLLVGSATGAVLVLLAALLSGVFGGSVAKEWGKLSEESATRARGQTTVRSLKLLFTNISLLQRRVAEYMARQQELQLSAEVIRTYLEEVAQRCLVINEEVISSIENWQDVLPEASVRARIGELVSLSEEAQALQSQRDALQRWAGQERDTSAEERERIRRELRAKESDLADTRKRLAQLQQRARSEGLLSTSSATGSGGSADPKTSRAWVPSGIGIEQDSLAYEMRVCRVCGKQFAAPLKQSGEDSADPELCPDCRAG